MSSQTDPIRREVALTAAGGPFGVLASDPPWKFGDKLPGTGRGAVKKYPVMGVEQICAMDVPDMLEDSVLFLWRVAAMQREALEVGGRWGFKLKAELVWQKLTRTGKPWFGMGHYVRASHETCLILTRGSFKPKLRNVRSTFSAPVPVGPDGKYVHSGKPDRFYEIVQELARGPYAEMFARRERPGWTVLGDVETGGER